ncbi:MAG: aminotransferase class I/II-fold pyridoxal phosphate-dependent enzyme [Clostridia bacterium]|nr:aminotransferase class I/II-fold pyridoxal phosphate-dependent enzyme [Clostridia bacterium]
MNDTHGGDLLTAQSRYRGEIVDFSANLNPLGMPESVRLAASAAARNSVHYPDPLCRVLTGGIALRDGVETEQVVCGNGAADLIFRLAFAERPKKALLTAPTFSEYEQALRAADCGVAYHELKEEHDFALTESVLDGLTGDVDIAFFCTPNNPTGSPIAADLMERILVVCAERQIRLVVDECFLELSDGAEAGGLAKEIARNPRLVLLRAFTKSYAMPGLRLGYALTSDMALMEKLALCAQPWSVSAPAQAAGAAALREKLHPILARELIRAERERLTAAMTALGLKVYPSSANYLLFRAAGVADLQEKMLRQGVLIRSCANYVGLGGDYYRIAVRLKGENEMLLRGLKEVL